MLTPINPGGGRRLKWRRLLASRQSTSNLFRDMERHNDTLVGVDLPIPNNPASQLQIQYDDDSFTATITNDQGHVINKFEAFYIEQDEYDDPRYDIYINDQAEEGVDEDAVANEFDNWIQDIRKLANIWGEEAEWELLNQGSISITTQLIAVLERLRDLPGTIDDKIAKIPPTILKKFITQVVYPNIEEMLTEDAETRLPDFVTYTDFQLLPDDELTARIFYSLLGDEPNFYDFPLVTILEDALSPILSSHNPVSSISDRVELLVEDVVNSMMGDIDLELVIKLGTLVGECDTHSVQFELIQNALNDFNELPVRFLVTNPDSTLLTLAGEDSTSKSPVHNINSQSFLNAKVDKTTMRGCLASFIDKGWELRSINMYSSKKGNVSFVAGAFFLYLPDKA